MPAIGIQLGSVRQLTNTAGTFTDTYNYDAFGNKLNTTGSTPNEFLYRGEQYDSDLGLYYLRARYYNPLTGRFMSRDPLDRQPIDPRAHRLVDPKELHKYLYADGDPVNGVDPTGKGMFEGYLIEIKEKAAGTLAMELTEISLQKIFDCVARELLFSRVMDFNSALDFCIETNP